MTLEQFKQVWAKAAVKTEAREKDYSALDAAAGGDGDHGEAIVAATKAKVGDKTFMDALIPAIEALKAHAAEGEQAMFAAAAAAAKAGSEATAQMQAKYGRAKNLGERSIGPIDAGSASNADIWLCFAEQ